MEDTVFKLKALRELTSISLFCFQEYLRTGNEDYKERRNNIQEAIEELEDYIKKNECVKD